MSSVDVLVPDLSESVADAVVATWHKKSGDAVVRDEVLVEIETDKVVLKVSVSTDGILDAVLEDEGTTATSRQILDRLRESNNAGKETNTKSEKKAPTPTQHQQAPLEEQSNDALNPAICRPLAEHNLDASAIKGAGMDGRLTREDVEKHLAKAPTKEPIPAAPIPVAQPALTTRSEGRVPVTRLHKRVAGCLLEAKNSIAMLTTFNGVNMKPIIDLRKQCGKASEKRHSIHLGFMSFYAKAMVEALKYYPEVNVSIDGGDVVYHSYSGVNMAVFTPRGLVTLVLRDIDTLGMADIEKKIKKLAVKGHDGKLTVEDLTGGNFIITNGGTFGSLISAPIISPPQSAILGMHAIRNRPIAVNSRVEILPMMYLALSYDHRLIDGRKSVGFLVTIEKLLEDPTCLLLSVQQFKFHLRCGPTWIECRSTV